MPKLTTQALALNDAYRASGAPTVEPKLPHQKKARKAYSVATAVKWHTYRDPRTGIKQRFFEYGDAHLHSPEMSHDEAVRVAEYLASAGFHGVVFPRSDGSTARVMGTSDYDAQGKVTIYHPSFDYTKTEHYEVPLVTDRQEAAWKRANAR